MRIPLILMFVFLALTSCARIPEPIDYTHTVQQKMQAAKHWEILASDVVGRINAELVRKDFLTASLYVKSTCGDETTPCSSNETSPFNEAFRDLLITRLVQTGIPTRQSPDEQSIAVNYKVQVVRHDATRFRTLQPGLITAVTGAILVFRNAPAEIIALATAGLVDYANQSLVRNGQYEVIITTSMAYSGRFIFRSSDIYYINDADFAQYIENGAPAKEIALIAPPPPPEKPRPKAIVQPVPLLPGETVIKFKNNTDI